MSVGFAVVQYGIKELGVGQGSETDFAVWSIPAVSGVHIAENEGTARTAATNAAYSYLTQVWHDLVEKSLSHFVGSVGDPEPLKMRVREELRFDRERVLVEMTEAAQVVEGRWQKVYATVELVKTAVA